MADDEARDLPPWRARWTPPPPSPSETHEEEAREDAALAETLGAFSTLPLLDGVSEAVASPEPVDEQFGEGETVPPEEASRLARFGGWLRWAAAPLGFFLFLAALTAYGVLRDRDGGDSERSAREPAALTGSTSTTAMSATTPTTSVIAAPTTLVGTPTTVVSEFTGVTTTLLTPGASSSSTPIATLGTSARSAPAAPPASAAAPPAQTTGAPVRYFGPACGHAPRQAVPITIDGRRERAVVADDNGCVSFTYYGPVCGYAPGDRLELVINGRPQLPVTAGPDGCVTAIRE